MEYIDILLKYVVEGAILLFELIGVGILIASGVRGFLCYVRKDPDTRLILAKGMAMGLEFKLGSEILRTVVVREWEELVVVAGIVALRAALTFLIHWEICQEENNSCTNYSNYNGDCYKNANINKNGREKG